MSVTEAYIYPNFGPKSSKPKGLQIEKRRLKSAVSQVMSVDELMAPLADDERAVVMRLVQEGADNDHAEYYVREHRELAKHRTPIPAGTTVDAWIVAWWGDKPEDDPNPLLMVESGDGAQGLTNKDNTEPAS
jgi:hypothetical protein